jgi:hypothetical protein
MPKDAGGYKQTKIEKTSDKTFNVHTERGDVFECTSPEKLSSLKGVSYPKSADASISGVGAKKELRCDACRAVVSGVAGVYDAGLGRLVYHCRPCAAATGKKV